MSLETRRGKVRFYECEHMDDAYLCADALGRCGAKIKSVTILEDDEEAVVEIEMNKPVKEFVEQFKGQEPEFYELSHFNK